MTRSDVVLNGLGGRVRGGIARGHSGIYLEQGVAKIIDSSVSNNTLTGISAVSSDNAILELSESELFNNGSFQLELPQAGTAARRRCDVSGNVMASQGHVQLRSALLNAKIQSRLNHGRMRMLRREDEDHDAGRPQQPVLGEIVRPQHVLF